MSDKKMLSDHPKLVSEWDFDKNNQIGVFPENYTIGSNKVVWWKCGLGHSYDSQISSRKNGSGCPYCSNQKILRGYNDFESQKPELMKFWDFSKNTLKPYEISSNSGKKVWWVCELDHSFENNPNSISRGKKCPYCSNKKVLVGFNDVAAIRPELVPLWSAKNESAIEEYVFGSAKIVWWKCAKEHEFKASIRSMVKKPDICATCSNKKVLAGFNDVATTNPEILKFWDYGNNVYLPSEVTFGRSADKTYFICSNGHSFNSTLSDVNQGKWCLQCKIDSYVSNPEKEIKGFLKNELNVRVECSNRNIISPYKVDLYIPEKNIAIEFNGLFWHSEKYMQKIGRKNIRYYHYHKWNLCRKKDVQLITIWEDDWNSNKDLIKNMLKYKLGLFDEEKIFARKTFAEIIQNDEAEDFLNKRHIQGFKKGCINAALKNKVNNEIVSVAQINKNKNSCTIQRYTSSCSVIGGFTKLLAYIEKNYPEIEKITTFADHEVSDGGLYENNGFEIDTMITPDYKYIYRNKRHHKFLFRKKRFEKDPSLLFDSDMTEKELAELNKISRVWDSGKTKYVKFLNKQQ